MVAVDTARAPRCHFPLAHVAYPSDFSLSAIVFSFSLRPLWRATLLNS